MRITICGSIEFAFEIKEIAERLLEIGHEVEIPMTAKKILDGELTMDEFKKEKETSGDILQEDSRCNKEILDNKNSDAILVSNLLK